MLKNYNPIDFRLGISKFWNSKIPYFNGFFFSYSIYLKFNYYLNYLFYKSFIFFILKNSVKKYSIEVFKRFNFIFLSHFNISRLNGNFFLRIYLINFFLKNLLNIFLKTMFTYSNNRKLEDFNLKNKKENEGIFAKVKLGWSQFEYSFFSKKLSKIKKKIKISKRKNVLKKKTIEKKLNLVNFFTKFNFKKNKKKKGVVNNFKNKFLKNKSKLFFKNKKFDKNFSKKNFGIIFKKKKNSFRGFYSFKYNWFYFFKFSIKKFFGIEKYNKYSLDYFKNQKITNKSLRKSVCSRFLFFRKKSLYNRFKKFYFILFFFINFFIKFFFLYRRLNRSFISVSRLTPFSSYSVFQNKPQYLVVLKKFFISKKISKFLFFKNSKFLYVNKKHIFLKNNLVFSYITF